MEKARSRSGTRNCRFYCWWKTLNQSSVPGSLGIVNGAWLAARLGIGAKAASYNWRHVAGTGALGGIGFTMSLFIAGQALTGDNFGAAKIAVFAASLIAGTLGVAILWKRAPETATASTSDAVESGTSIGGV